jgi:hypothetical protein
MKYIRELEECRPKKMQQVANTSSNNARPRWVHPPEGIAKIRVDGAVSRAAKEGTYSAICRDHDGKYLGSSAIRVSGITDPGTLEALACREALALALDLGLPNVLVASDCKVVVNEIKLGRGGMYESIVKEIRNTSEQFQQCTFIFEGRGTNLEAHSLAKHTFGLDLGRHLWLINPPDLNCIPMNILE